MRKKASILTHPPQRAETRCSPSKAALLYLAVPISHAKAVGGPFSASCLEQHLFADSWGPSFYWLRLLLGRRDELRERIHGRIEAEKPL